MLKIVADENIPLAEAFFTAVGDVTLLPGRLLSSSQVASADVLLVRSVTPVNATLLAGSSVRFVGTCTIGTDHLDLAYLQQRGIAWSNAPGCNANSVVEYVFGVLARLRPAWLDASFGIIGCGNVGGRLYRRLRDLGLPCRVYDPLLTAADNPDLADLDSVLQADVICVHAPLTTAGRHPSYHLLDRRRLENLPANSLLISAGRGAVVDNQALKQLLVRRNDLQVALDVWEPEPDLDLQLLQKVQLASPHIAGYSYDGKVSGTAMIYQALQHFLGTPPESSLQQLTARYLGDVEAIEPRTTDHQAVLNEAILGAWDIAEDDARLRGMATQPASGRSSYFDDLRKHYRRRREFHGYRVTLAKDLPRRERIGLDLQTLGFCVAE